MASHGIVERAGDTYVLTPGVRDLSDDERTDLIRRWRDALETLRRSGEPRFGSIAVQGWALFPDEDGMKPLKLLLADSLPLPRPLDPEARCGCGRVHEVECAV